MMPCFGHCTEIVKHTRFFAPRARFVMASLGAMSHHLPAVRKQKRWHGNIRCAAKTRRNHHKHGSGSALPEHACTCHLTGFILTRKASSQVQSLLNTSTSEHAHSWHNFLYIIIMDISSLKHNGYKGLGKQRIWKSSKQRWFQHTSKPEVSEFSSTYHSFSEFLTFT